AAEMRGRLLEAIELAHRGAEIVVRLVVRRVQRQHAMIARLRRGGAMRLAQQIAELVVRLEEIGIAFDRLAESGFGFGLAAEHLEKEAERAAGIGPLRRELDGALDVRGGLLRVSGAERQDAEQMPRAGMRLVAREDVAAGRLRVGE